MATLLTPPLGSPAMAKPENRPPQPRLLVGTLGQVVEDGLVKPP